MILHHLNGIISASELAGRHMNHTEDSGLLSHTVSASSALNTNGVVLNFNIIDLEFLNWFFTMQLSGIYIVQTTN